MIDKLQKLALILERLDVLYLRAHEILGREKHALIQCDFEGVLISVNEKDEVLSAIRALDRDRLRIQDQFALVMDRSPEEVSLKFIGEQMVLAGGEGGKIGARLLVLRDQLGKTIDSVRQKIELNRDFIEHSVDNLRSVAASVTATIHGRSIRQKAPNVYTGKARIEQKKEQTGSILEKRL